MTTSIYDKNRQTEAPSHDHDIAVAFHEGWYETHPAAARGAISYLLRRVHTLTRYNNRLSKELAELKENA